MINESFLYSHLQDGMHHQWDKALIAQTLRDYVVKHKIDTVINDLKRKKDKKYLFNPIDHYI